MRHPWSTFLAASAGLALAAVFSCKTFDLPDEACDPSSLVTKQSLQSEDGCSRCLEDNCCDAVGVCEREEGCAAIVQGTQRCVLDAKLKGASAENDCAASAGLTLTADNQPLHPAADGAYRCMRGSCGVQCGLPVCKVDKAAPLIRNAKCDECFAGGCCPELNRCYDNRACKLMLECIISECGTELGKSLNEAGAGPPDSSSVGLPDNETLCRLKPPSFGAPQCVLTCLCRYRENDQGLPPSDRSLLPFSLAQAVYECGKAARCGDVCTPGSDNADAQ